MRWVASWRSVSRAMSVGFDGAFIDVSLPGVGPCIALRHAFYLRTRARYPPVWRTDTGDFRRLSATSEGNLRQGGDLLDQTVFDRVVRDFSVVFQLHFFQQQYKGN